MFRDFGIGSTEQYHRRCLRVVRYARQFFKEPRTFSGQTAWCDAKRKSKLYVPCLVPGHPLSSPLSDFAILVTRAARLPRRAGIELTSRGINWYRQAAIKYADSSLRALRRCSSVRIVHVSECRMSVLSSYGDSPRYYTTRRIDNRHEITLYLPANWLIPMKCEIPLLGEDIYQFVVCDGKLHERRNGRKNFPLELSTRGEGRGEIVKRFNVRINVLIITQPWQFDYRRSNCGSNDLYSLIINA